MVLGKYSRIDNRRQSSSYCSTITIVVFVALCLVGIWMMTSSAIPAQNVILPVSEKEGPMKKPFSEKDATDTKPFADTQGDLPDEAIRGDIDSGEEVKPSGEDTREESIDKKSEGSPEDKEQPSEQTMTPKFNEKAEEKTQEKIDSETSNGDKPLEVERTKSVGQGGSDENASDDNDQTSDLNSENSTLDLNETNVNGEATAIKDGETKDDLEALDDKNQKIFGNSSNGKQTNETSDETFPSAGQSDLFAETASKNASWSTQAVESKNEKDAQIVSSVKKWKLCNSSAGPDFIPCLDNLQAVKLLTSTKHYEHRERHCPPEPPTCLVPLPDGYKTPIQWPLSRDKIWYNNVPHTKLAVVKGHQNWIKVNGDYLTFPGGGTQFTHGALHYIDFINEALRELKWGKRTRVILDVGCGVASFGGHLFDRDVLAMSFAPKDEHEAQVQFALERGIPAISAVMGTQRLPFPAMVFDAVHCARCRVPWHIEGGKLLLELNRVLRPGGFFIWSATPVYRKKPEDMEIWKAMKKLTASMCWDMVQINKDSVNDVAIATFRKPSVNVCYDQRREQKPPMCGATDNRNAAWNVPLQECMHKIPVGTSERGSQWPEQWPSRLKHAPYWLSTSLTGVYGKPEPEDFAADYSHWKTVVSKSYINGVGINWKSVRNVMDMRAIYGGFAAALKDKRVWVMNVVPVDSPDTLPIIYDRGLFGVYHDWCESFSTYPRTYDLLHADHLFSKIKKRCSLVPLVFEVDRILRPGGKLIVRDDADIIGEVEAVVKSFKWETRMTYSNNNEGLLVVEKSTWRPVEYESLNYALA